MSAVAFLAATRLSRGRRDVVTLVGRPHSPVAHLYVGPLTRSGRYAAAAGRTVCRARTRRLSVLERDVSVLDRRGRRVCARCVAALPDRPLRTSEEWKSAYAHLTVLDLVNANHLVRSTTESHRVGFLAGLLFDPPPVSTAKATTPEAAELRALHDRIVANRSYWRIRELPPEDREAQLARREAEAMRAEQIAAQRRHDARLDRLVDLRNRNSYMTASEREQLNQSA